MEMEQRVEMMRIALTMKSRMTLEATYKLLCDFVKTDTEARVAAMALVPPPPGHRSSSLDAFLQKVKAIANILEGRASPAQPATDRPSERSTTSRLRRKVRGSSKGSSK